MLPATHLNRFKLLIIALLLSLVSSASCRIPPAAHRQDLDGLSHFEFRAAEPAMEGVVVGAPDGGLPSVSATLAHALSDRTGAGLVTAHGFRTNRMAVARPFVRTTPYQMALRDPAKRRGVHREFNQTVRDVAGDNIDLYLEFRSTPSKYSPQPLQVASSGFSFEELKIIKQSYLDIRDRLIGMQPIQRLPLLINPLDSISWESSVIRHHGFLLVAERGLSLRLAERLFSGAVLSLYADIFSAWLTEIVRIVRENPCGLQQPDIKIMDLGRLDLFHGGSTIHGIVIGSPHGTYDAYTAELVQQISHQTGMPAVISSGFTPTETGGWRINVNRPTEKSYWAPEFEIESERSQEVYRTYKDLVLQAARGEVALYFDIHQYGGRRIQVATVGIAIEEAKAIKIIYQKIRDEILVNNPDVDPVALLIEPLDAIEIGAWPAKAGGILTVAKKSLHLELPLYTLFRTEKSRSVYAKILAELLKRIARDPDFGPVLKLSH
jgi:hypothetical protein